MNQSLAEAQHQQLPCPSSLSPAPLVTGSDAIVPDPIPTPPTSSSCANPIAILNNNKKKLIIGLIVYVIIGIVIFCTTSFELGKTYKLVDALYYIVVTLCTIGYGDIVPSTTLAKYLTCFFILLGFGFFEILLNGLVAYICDKESVLLRPSDGKFKNMIQTYMVDKEKGRIRTRSKIGHTTLGYGDLSFKTTAGRCFAIVWLLVSTLAVARAFLYFTKLRMEKRNRRITDWVLQKEVDNDGCISKSDFIIYKLKEMGRVAESDILQICKKFDSLEHSNNDKITLADLMEGNR
ncbi:PREDICTED: two-pore potassium channel [Prunus dulcis]|uniref:PREDICTED: two-pore potassium channel n=1 Tax=Prunus dulcis TaxID=3755 RepID=A0A5E4G1A1_PRUDU|nr:PREDICTED: two-pore potassium channel [Prunus dulcis]